MPTEELNHRNKLIEVIQQSHQASNPSLFWSFCKSFPFPRGSRTCCNVYGLALVSLDAQHTFSNDKRLKESAKILLILYQRFTFESLPESLWDEWSGWVRQLFTSFVEHHSWDLHSCVQSLWDEVHRVVNTSTIGAESDRLREEICSLHEEMDKKTRKHHAEMVMLQEEHQLNTKELKKEHEKKMQRFQEEHLKEITESKKVVSEVESKLNAGVLFASEHKAQAQFESEWKSNVIEMHSAMMNAHTEMLSKHMATMDTYSAIMDKHFATMDKHLTTMDNHFDMMKELLDKHHLENQMPKEFDKTTILQGLQ